MCSAMFRKLSHNVIAFIYQMDTFFIILFVKFHSSFCQILTSGMNKIKIIISFHFYVYTRLRRKGLFYTTIAIIKTKNKWISCFIRKTANHL